jgi:hypothetical protein
VCSYDLFGVLLDIVFLTGQKEGYSKMKEKIQDYIFNYFRDKIINFSKNTLNISSKIIITIETLIKLTVFDIIKIIINKYGFGYLLKYVFYLSLFI